ncbi:hypothetical protein ACT691_18945 [Vibrio metschnikovii]
MLHITLYALAHEAYHAATELVTAASITYEAAIAAYRNDIGSD